MSASTLKRLGPTQVELEFGIPAADLERAREQAFRELSRNVRMPGFRPGKVPRKVFESAYGTAGIEERAFDKLLPAAYERALEEAAVEPVEQARIELASQGEVEADEVRIKATVAIRPAIVLGDYRAIEVGSIDEGVSENELTRSLESLRRGSAELVPVDRAIQAGDVATVDFAGTIDGKPFEGGTATNQAIEVSEDRFIPGFAAGIFGMKAGETKEIEARFPDTYNVAELAGKPAAFTVTVHDVKEPQVPELDDEFAARILREGGTVDELRSDLRDRLARTNEARARRTMTGELLEKLRDMHDVPLPEVMVERETESLMDDARRDATRAGATWEGYLSEAQRTDEDVRAEARIEAERRVKTSLLLDAIARAERIEATKADVESELANLSRQYGRPPSEIAELLRPNMPALVDGVVRSKTVDFLMRQAKRVLATPEPEAE
jgi:trigger factor